MLIRYRYLFYAFVLLIVVFSTTYQDFFLVNSFGELFRSPVVLLLPLFLGYELLKILKRSVVRLDTFEKYIFAFIFLYCIVSFCVFIRLIIVEGKSIVLLHENLIGKTLKFPIYLISLILIYRFVIAVMLKLTNNTISNIFILLTVFYSLFILVEYLTLPNAFLYLHSRYEIYWRIRMLTAESSWTGGIAILLLAGINIHKSTKGIITSIIFTTIFIATSGSKAFLGVILLSTGLYILLSKISILRKIGFSLLGILLAIFIVPKIMDSLSIDMEQYTSLITRASTSIASYVCLYKYPMGTGGAYYYYVLNEIVNVGYWISSFFGLGNLNEILGWGTEGAQNISAGSEFGHWMVILGIPGAIMFLLLLRNYFLLLPRDSLFMLFYIYVALVIFFIEPMYVHPQYAVFFALIVKYSKTLKDGTKIG